MRDLRSVVGILVALGALAGCANQNSIYRVSDTEPSKSETILIDAKQRPITVNTVTDPKHPKLCLARSADALSQAAASGNLKFTQGTTSADLGITDTEQVSSIAFRTQVTEAQQEFLYYLCQFNANGAISDDEVSDDLRHFQNTMLALVAVDDLAAAAKNSAAQKKGTNAPATNTPSPEEQTVTKDAEAVNAAKTSAQSAITQAGTSLSAATTATTLAGAKTAADKLEEALKAVDSKLSDYANSIATLRAAIQQVAGAAAKEPDTVTQASSSVNTAFKPLQTDLAAAQNASTKVSVAADLTALTAAQQDLSTKVKAYTAAASAYDLKLNSLAQATSKYQTAALKAAQPAAKKAGNKNPGGGGGKEPSNGSDQGSDAGNGNNNAADTPSAVANIVQTIVWQSFTTEKCLKWLFVDKVTLNDDMKKFCIDHLNKADDLRIKQAASAAPGVAQQPLGGAGTAEEYGPTQ